MRVYSGFYSILWGGYMEEKKLKKIGKKELLEILLSQANRIDELEKELSKAQKQLDSKKYELTECGNLAEAALKLNGVFETAQAAAEQYLLNVQEKCKKIEKDTMKACEHEKNKIIKNTEKICDRKKREAEKYLVTTARKAKQQGKKKVTNNTKSK